MTDIKKILLPTDFSEGSEAAVSYALSLAGKYGAHIDVLHIIHEYGDMTDFYVPHISFDVIEKGMEDAARSNMENFCRENIEGKATFEIHTRKGTPFLEIIEAARELKSDLIVMGTHGRTGIDHILFGSTAGKVVRKSSIPVLTVRREGKDFKMP
ncbi:MAG: universal stress protein [bacterium]|nr:universal stress protein [bacterium]